MLSEIFDLVQSKFEIFYLALLSEARTALEVAFGSGVQGPHKVFKTRGAITLGRNFTLAIFICFN